MSFLQRAKRVGRKFVNPVPTEVGGLKLAFRVIPLLITNKAESFPKRPLGPFRTDPSLYAQSPVSGLRVTWFGHSSMLVEIDGVRVLVDPVWDERASPTTWAGPKRFFPPTLPLQQMPKLDAVLISHDHYDHLGEKTVRRLSVLQPEVRWVTSLGVAPILRRFGVAAERISELDWTQSVQVEGAGGAKLEITSLPSRHFSGRSAFNRFETLWASFLLQGSEHRVLYGADSGCWEGFGEIGTAYGPFDLTMLEIGAFNELWQQIHMGPDGAMESFRRLGGSGLLMPIHWGLFDLALHGWREPIERIRELADSAGVRLWSPEPGRPTEVVRGVELLSGWWGRFE